MSHCDDEGDNFEGTMPLHMLRNNQELIQQEEYLEEEVVVNQPRENLLTESEVRDMVRRFNESMNKHTLEQ